jgi:hypothetical protein
MHASSIMQLFWLLNALILAVAFTLAIIIGIHASRKKYYSKPVVILWILISFFLFPIGPILYYLFSRQRLQAS